MVGQRTLDGRDKHARYLRVEHVFQVFRVPRSTGLMKLSGVDFEKRNSGIHDVITCSLEVQSIFVHYDVVLVRELAYSRI